MTKIRFKIIGVLVGIAFLSGVVYAINTWNTGYKSTKKTTIKTYHGSNNNPDTTTKINTCTAVTNTSNIDYFVPTKLLGDWNAFTGHKPSGVTTGNCDSQTFSATKILYGHWKSQLEDSYTMNVLKSGYYKIKVYKKQESDQPHETANVYINNTYFATNEDSGYDGEQWETLPGTVYMSAGNNVIKITVSSDYVMSYEIDKIEIYFN